MTSSALTARFQVPSEYAVPEEDAARLRTLLNLRVDDDKPLPDLPDAIVAGYYVMKRCCDIMGCGLHDPQLATVVCFALLSESGSAKPVELVPEMPKNFMDIVRERGVKMGTLVAVEFAGGIKPGYFCGFVEDRVQVQVSGVDRFLELDKVRPATDSEFPEMRRNVNDPS